MPQPPRPPQAGDDFNRRMFNAFRTAAAASLAGGIIAASGKPHTPAEAVQVLEQVRAAMRPAGAPPPGQGQGQGQGGPAQGSFGES